MDSKERFKRIVDRLKGRDVKLSEASLFLEPDYFTFFNESVKEIEIRRRKKFNKREYKELIMKFSSDEFFLENCKRYKDNSKSLTKPRMTFIKKGGENLLERYSVNNLKAAELKRKTKRKENQMSEYYRMHQSLKNSPGFDFLKKFDDINKLRILIMEIKEKCNRHGFSLNIDEEKMLLEYFYNDKKFNHFYELYKKSGNKFYKPTLNFKTPLSKGGKNNKENIQFISRMENSAKSDMTMEEWSENKKIFKTFFS